MSKPRCCAEVHESYGVGFRACTNLAKVERDGKHYCGVHDPVAVAARNAKRKAENDAAWEAKASTWRNQAERASRAYRALELLEASYQDDPLGNLERLIAADKEAGE